MILNKPIVVQASNQTNKQTLLAAVSVILQHRQRQLTGVEVAGAQHDSGCPVADVQTADSTRTPVPRTVLETVARDGRAVDTQVAAGGGAVDRGPLEVVVLLHHGFGQVGELDCSDRTQHRWVNWAAVRGHNTGG